MRCRTCANYNPLRMLYELHNQKEKIQLSVPMEVILDDAKIQLEHQCRQTIHFKVKMKGEYIDEWCN